MFILYGNDMVAITVIRRGSKGESAHLGNVKILLFSFSVQALYHVTFLDFVVYCLVRYVLNRHRSNH